MPIQKHNRGRQRSTKHEVTINGLLTARGRQLQSLRLGTGPNAQANIDAIDHVLVNVLAFTGDIAEESRDFRRVATFKRGELRRLVGETLRKAERPLTALEIAQAVYATKGLEVSYSRKIKHRVQSVRLVLNKINNTNRGTNCLGHCTWSLCC